MNILFWLPVVEPNGGLGGAVTQSLRLILGLCERGHTVAVLAGRHNWQFPYRGTLYVNEKPVPVLWLPSPPLRVIGSVLHLLFSFLYLVLNAGRFQVVHVVSLKPLPVCVAYLAQLLGRFVVCRSIGGDVQIVASILNKHSVVRRWYEGSLHRLAHVVAQSKDNARALEEVGIPRQNIMQIPNGVDVTHFRPDPIRRQLLRERAVLPEGCLVVCNVSQLRPEKRVDVTVKAFQPLSVQYPRSRLYLVGSGPKEHELHQLAESLNVSDSVTFVGLVNDPLDYLQMADVFVLSSDEETHSNALLEAMACGLPAVVTAVGGNRLTIAHSRTGLLVPPDSPDELADALAQIHSRPGLATQLGTAARQVIIERYSLDHMVECYEQLYALALVKK